jgi:hypothetical protein
MTLTTRIRIQTPEPVEAVWAEARRLIGGGDARFEERCWSGVTTRAHATDQGLPALLWMHWTADGPLPAYGDGPAIIEVDYDTGYAYQANGAGCGDLHAWLVRELGVWLEDRGARFRWQDEFTGEWLDARAGLDRLGDADRGALS